MRKCSHNFTIQGKWREGSRDSRCLLIIAPRSKMNLPGSRRRSSCRTSWRRSARRRGSTPRPSRRRSGRWPAASTPPTRCGTVSPWSPASPRSCRQRCAGKWKNISRDKQKYLQIYKINISCGLVAGGCLDCCVIYCVGVRSAGPGPGLPRPARGKYGEASPQICPAGAGQRGRV